MTLNPEVDSRWASIASKYNKFRISPPIELIEWILQLSSIEGRPELVVDIGCGTGLSTRPWVDYANKVIGIDPSYELLSIAGNESDSENIIFQKGTGNQTGLNDNSVDILTSVHSIHWMEPDSTIAEALRILKKESIFSVYNHSFAPMSKFMSLEYELFIFKQKISELASRYELENDMFSKDFKEYLIKRKVFKQYRYFDFTQTIHWSAEDYIGWIYTWGNVQKLLKKIGLNTQEIGLDRFSDVIKKYYGNDKHSMLLNWQVIIFRNPIKL